MHKIFSSKRRALLLVILILSNILITSLSLIIVYKDSFSIVKETLLGIVERQKSLINTLYEQGKSQEDIIEFIQSMRQKQYKIGQSGEFVIARKAGDSVLFLISAKESPFYKIIRPDNHGAPIYWALQNKNGFIKAKDYNGVPVYAAYTYIPSVQLGVVAQIPVSEVNKPYFNALLTATFVFIVFISLSLFLFIKVSDPIIKATFDNEQRLRSIFENTQAGYFYIDVHGMFRKVNKAWLDLYKYNDFNEVIGKHFTNVQQLNDIESAKEFVEKIQNGVPDYMTGDFSRKCKDGSLGYHSFSAHPVYQGNTCIGIEGFIIDITELKETEQALINAKNIAEENEKKYQSMFNTMQEGVYLHEIIYDNKGKATNYRIIEANPASEKYLNIKREDAIGKLATDLFGTAEAPFLDTYARVAATCGPTTFEEYFRPMDKYFLISVFSPKKGQFATAFLDITKTKNYEKKLIAQNEEYAVLNEELQQTNLQLIIAKEKAEKNERLLRISEEKFYKSFSSNPTASTIVNKKSGKFIAVNKAAEKLIGYEENELIGKTSNDFNFYVNPDDRNKVWGYVLEKGCLRDFEVKFYHKNKKEILTRISIETVEINNEECFISSYEDITERRLLETNLILAKEKAEESDRLKTAFLQNMSHEIRTPMNAIMGFAELLPANFSNKEKLNHFSTIINKRSRDLLDIINDILDISKIESGQLPVHIENCNLAALIAEIQLLFNEQQVHWNKQHIQFSFRTHLNLNELTINTDVVKLKQIFINLITNAFKFTEKGKIEVGYIMNGSRQLRFYVSDTGIGIPSDKHQYIFERFAQIHYANNRQYGGTGLGLAIAKGLVELLGGKIWLESDPGKGTIFHFTIDDKN